MYFWTSSQLYILCLTITKHLNNLPGGQSTCEEVRIELSTSSLYYKRSIKAVDVRYLQQWCNGRLPFIYPILAWIYFFWFSLRCEFFCFPSTQSKLPGREQRVNVNERFSTDKKHWYERTWWTANSRRIDKDELGDNEGFDNWGNVYYIVIMHTSIHTLVLVRLQDDHIIDVFGVCRILL